MGSPVENATEAVEQDFAGYDPQEAGDMIGLFDGLPDFWEKFSDAWASLAAKCDSDLPIHPAVVEHMREMGAVIAGQKDAADELQAIFRFTHDKDIKRHEEPRPAEATWNV